MFNLYYEWNVLLYIARQWNSNRSCSISEICQPWLHFPESQVTGLKPSIFRWFGRCVWILQREFVDSSWLYIGSAGYEFCTSAVFEWSNPCYLEHPILRNMSSVQTHPMKKLHFQGKKEQFVCSLFDTFEQQGQPINRPDNIDMWLLFFFWWHADTGQTW